MQLDIRGLGLKLSDALLEHARKQLDEALAPFHARIAQVRVRMNDVNGPRGGHDKRCHVELRLRTGGRVVLHEVDEDLYVAISLAAARLKRAVSQRIDRHHPRERRPRLSASGLAT